MVIVDGVSSVEFVVIVVVVDVGSDVVFIIDGVSSVEIDVDVGSVIAVDVDGCVVLVVGCVVVVFAVSVN